MRAARLARSTWLSGLAVATAAAGVTTAAAQAIARPAHGLPSPAASASWPQFRLSSDHSGDNALERTLKRGNVATLAKKWNFPTGGIIYFSSPSVAGGVVYIGSADHYLYAVRARTGKQIWRFHLPNPVEASPAVGRGIVYTGEGSDGPDGLLALRASTGKKLWGVPTGGTVIGSPTLAGGRVYFNSTDGYVHAVNATTGKRAWKHHIGGFNETSPAVAHGVVYVGSATGAIYALKATTGRKL